MNFRAGIDGNASVDSHWVLMRKEPLPINRRHFQGEPLVQNKLDLLEEYNRKSGIVHALPNVIDAVACSLLMHVCSEMQLFELNTYSRCITFCPELDKIKLPTCVGFFDRGTLLIEDFNSDNALLQSIAPLRKL